MLGNRGILEGRPADEDIMRKETKRRTKARRKSRYLFTNVAFFDLMA